MSLPLVYHPDCWDLPLSVGIEDGAYLAILAATLPDLLSQVKPDLVFYDAGVDPHHDDALGKLALTDEGLYRKCPIQPGKLGFVTVAISSRNRY